MRRVLSGQLAASRNSGNSDRKFPDFRKRKESASALLPI
jgi:hypothetical protein